MKLMRQKGFTLIELSIVLVIIGLIIGGVLVGRDLIRAAEIRATIGQKEKFDAAATAFKLKYGYLPGDIAPELAGTFGLFQGTPLNTLINTHYRFNDGRINYSEGTASSYTEYNLFWVHLSEANLIEGNYGHDATYPVLDYSGGISSYSISNRKYFYPPAKIPGLSWTMEEIFRFQPDGNGVDPGWSGSYNLIGNRDNPGAPGTLYYYGPAVSYAIDKKIDDGMPNTGYVFDLGGIDWWASTPTANRCTYGGVDAFAAEAQYNLAPEYADQPSCYLKIKAGF